MRQKLKDSLKAVDHSVKVNPELIESQVFTKAKSKDEYLELSARYDMDLRAVHIVNS